MTPTAQNRESLRKLEKEFEREKEDQERRKGKEATKEMFMEKEHLNNLRSRGELERFFMDLAIVSSP